MSNSKKRWLLGIGLTALNLGIASSSTGIAGQIIQLMNGDSVQLQGTTVTCNSDRSRDDGGGQNGGNGHPYPRPPQQPQRPVEASVPGQSVYYQGEQLLFYRGAAGQLMVNYRSSGRMRDLGGGILGNPMAFIDSNGEPRVIAVGLDETYFSRTLESGWEGWGGKLLEAPKVLVANGETYVIGRGLNQAVYYHTLRQGWNSLGGVLVEPIRAFLQRGEIMIQGVGSNGRIYDRTLSRDWQISN